MQYFDPNYQIKYALLTKHIKEKFNPSEFLFNKVWIVCKEYEL